MTLADINTNIDPDTFQTQVRQELEPLYLREQSPVAAMRMKSRTASSFAWLGPMALVGVILLGFFLVMPFVNALIQQGMGLVVVVVLPLLLLLLANELGKRHKQQKQLQRAQQAHVLAELRAMEPEQQDWILFQQRFEKQKELSVDEQAQLLEHWEQVALRQAEGLLERPDIRQALCPALQSSSSDVFVIARTITPIMLERIEQGTLLIPRVPVLCAALALHIYRQGISAYCAEAAPDNTGAASSEPTE
jgi:hypothetical protein